MKHLGRAALTATLSGALCVGLLGSLAVAQEGNPAADAVTLAFKFVQGKVTRQQVKLNADMKLGMGAQGEQPGQEIPMQMGITMMLNQKVDSVSPEGEGTLSVMVDSMDMLMSFFGQNFAIKGAKGKVSVTLNGQSLPVEGSPAGQLGLDQMLGNAFTLKIGRTGQVATMGSLAQGPLANVPGMSNAQQVFSGGVTLPDHPVKPGESWENKATVPMPLQGGKTVQMQLNTVNTLKSVATKGGHQIALIETKGDSALAGEGAPDKSKFSQSFSGTTEFDVTSGEPKSTKMDMEIALDMASLLATAGTGTGDTPTSGFPAMNMKGRITINAGPVPTTAAKKPATKKPTVRKAPARR